MRDYEYEHDSTYCYPESKVLKNKLNIKDASKLIEAERNITAIRILELKLEPPNGDIRMGRENKNGEHFKRFKLLLISIHRFTTR